MDLKEAKATISRLLRAETYPGSCSRIAWCLIKKELNKVPKNTTRYWVCSGDPSYLYFFGEDPKDVTGVSANGYKDTGCKICHNCEETNRLEINKLRRKKGLRSI